MPPAAQAGEVPKSFRADPDGRRRPAAQYTRERGFGGGQFAERGGHLE
ncbi:hypothetical protein [Microbacterium sp. SORGH_AS_0505]|nr:hypothetical protein [Microbacterium sp. SORGH_AS_0505]